MDRPSLLRNLRALPPAAWILFAGSFVNRFGSFVLPFLVIYLRQRGLPIRTAGLALASYGLGHVVAALLGGHLADRIGRRNTIAISMFAGAVTMLALSQARSLPWIIGLTMVAGLTSELYRPASSALITDLVAPEQRMAAFSMYRFAVNLGFAAGPATAGFLATRSFFYVFLGDALTSIAYGFVALLFLPHGLRGYSAEEHWAEALQVIGRDRRFLFFLASTCCITLVDFQMLSTDRTHRRPFARDDRLSTLARTGVGGVRNPGDRVGGAGSHEVIEVGRADRWCYSPSVDFSAFSSLVSSSTRSSNRRTRTEIGS